MFSELKADLDRSKRVIRRQQNQNKSIRVMTGTQGEAKSTV